MPPTVRAATKEDAEAVARTYVETWRDAYPGMLPDKVLLGLSAPRHAESWRRRIGEAGEIVIVAEDGEAGIVGFGSAGRARDANLGHAGEIYTLYLLPDWRDRGLGRALLGALFDALVARGYGSAPGVGAGRQPVALLLRDHGRAPDGGEGRDAVGRAGAPARLRLGAPRRGPRVSARPRRARHEPPAAATAPSRRSRNAASAAAQ